MAIDPKQIRQQFTCFRHSTPLYYFDSAATAQVPDAVLQAMHSYYTEYKANVHRGVHGHVDAATNAYEAARTTVQKFVNAKDANEIVFTKNCTESINTVAQSWAKQNLQAEDVVLLSIYEHHSNIVPWLQLQQEIGIHIRWWKDLNQEPDFTGVRLVSITGQSNVTGIRPDLSTIVRNAHHAGAKVLVDAAQLVVHHPVDVQELGCDFFVFSGHKLYGPTGIGALYATQEVQAQMHPYQGGGGMIHQVQEQQFSAAEGTAKFEAGTPPIAQAIGLAAAIKWLQQLHWRDIEDYENTLAQYAHRQLSNIDTLQCIAAENQKIQHGTSCLSFTIPNMHPHDLTDILGQKNIHLRAGHHCTQPLHEYLHIPASTRLSLALYNTTEEIDVLCTAIEEAKEILESNR